MVPGYERSTRLYPRYLEDYRSVEQARHSPASRSRGMHEFLRLIVKKTAHMQPRRLRGLRAFELSPAHRSKYTLLGIGGATEDIDCINSNNHRYRYDRTVRIRTRSDACIDALASVEVGLGMVVNAVYAGAPSPRAQSQTIHVFAHSHSILITLRILGRRPGQAIVSKLLKHLKYLEGFSDRVVFT
jgi:hypothetical protein